MHAWIIPNLIELDSNVQYIPQFMYGERFPPVQRTYPHPEITVRYHVQSNRQINTPSSDTIIHNYYRIANDRIYYQQALGMGLTLKLSLQYDDDGISIVVNPLYHQLIRTPMTDIIPPGRHVSDVLGIKLLARGYTSLHASAFSINKKATVICAPSDTGKTVSVVHAVSRGCDFLSEDIAITNGKQLWGCPHTFGLAPHAHLTGVPRLVYAMYQYVPIVRHFLQGVINVDATRVFSAARIITQAEVKRLMILTTAPTNSSHAISKQQAISTMIAFNRQEFPYQNPILFALQHFRKIDISRMISTEHQIIHDLVHQADEIVLLKGQPNYFTTHIDHIIKKRARV